MHTLKVGGRTVTLEPADDLVPLDFAVGVFNGKAYVGYFRTFKLVDRGNLMDTDIMPVLIFEDQEIVYEKDNLAEIGARRLVTPVLVDNWWSGRFVEVDPKSYYQEVFENFNYYIDAPEPRLHLLSIWTIGTIFHTLFQAYPYLHLFGAMRSGKTKTLTLIGCMGFNAIKTHSMSEATIYRLVEGAHATVLLDEQDYLVNPERRAEFRTLLLGGYKNGSFVYRSEKTSKGKIVPTRFRIYSPKALANIEGLESVLQDRTITIIMLRSKDPVKTRRDVDEDDPKWMEMRTKLASLYVKHWKEVSDAYDAVLKALGDVEDMSGIPENLRPLFHNAREFIYSRNRELWSPMLALALFFELKGVEGLVEKILEVAKENVAEREVDDIATPEVGLIQALHSIYSGDRYYTLSDITQQYKQETGVENITPERIGRMLKRLDFRDKRVVAGYTQYFISKKKIEDLARRFNVILEDTPKQGVDKKPLQHHLLLQPLQEVLEKAVRWAVSMGEKGFSVEELASALGLSLEDTQMLVEIMLKDAKLVKIGDRYRAI
jgi:hypothetical protein